MKGEDGGRGSETGYEAEIASDTKRNTIEILSGALAKRNI